MSSTSDKIKGTINEIVGKTKQSLGSATDDNQLRREGVAQEVKGNAQHAVGKAKDAVKKAVDKA